MNRLMLSLACSALLATHLNAFADSSAGAAPAGAQTAREQLDAQREQLSGADQVRPVAQAANTLVDAPVDTSDAPAQVSQP